MATTSAPRTVAEYLKDAECASPECFMAVCILEEFSGENCKMLAYYDISIFCFGRPIKKLCIHTVNPLMCD